MEEAIKTLLNAGNESLIVFTKRNLLGEEVNIEELWTLPQVKRILKKQQSNARANHGGYFGCRLLGLLFDPNWFDDARLQHVCDTA